MAAGVVALDGADTVQGGSIAIDTTDGVNVDGAIVVKSDIGASNGAISAIDRGTMLN